MRPRLCMCCGKVVTRGMASDNPNICVSCGDLDCTPLDQFDLALSRIRPNAISRSEPKLLALACGTEPLTSGEPHLIHGDGPDLIGCLEAEIAAMNAFAASVTEHARTLEQQLWVLRQKAVKG